MSARRALSIGVAKFDGHVGLDFAHDLVRRLGGELGEFGYEVQEVTREELTGHELGTMVTGALTSAQADDLAVVHLISHGERADGDATVFVLGSDGGPHADASVAHWLTMQQTAERPLALFFLDLCSAGTSARLPWQVRLDQPIRGWVVAACGAEEAAYDGRFTEAVITVLQAVRAGELDIDPSMPHVPLSTVARAIRQEVNRLAKAADAYPQQVTASLVDISADVEPPFFRNPAYDPAERPSTRASVDPGVLPFLDDLDEGLDARHFLERATGFGRLTDTNSGLVGCFTGRDRELRRISPWLNGVGDELLCVVTGSPGSGKSALLGVLVCAASQALRGITKPIWDRVAQAPLPIPDLAAVHARQRGLGTVTSSIARQLNLPENSSTPDLVSAMRSRAHRPVVVVDALDEADDPERLMTELLLPLIDPSAPGAPVRLLVGVRRYSTFDPLFARAWMVDLDDVEQSVLEDNLFDYVKSLLRATVEYRARGGVTGAFAHSVASVLAAPGPDGKRRWGPFLAAGLYTRHFITANAEEVVTDSRRAEEIGRQVPSDLRGLLDLDLELDRDQFWLRPVMSALAHARGAGMPVSVLMRVVPAFAGSTARPTAAQIRSVLHIVKFYLRQSMDSDRSNLYRLFHQGLADTLAVESTETAGAVLDAMLSSLGPPNSRDWDAAEPYLFRHIATHAAQAGRSAEIETDPGLLLHPDSSLALTAAADDSQAAESLASSARRFADAGTPAELALAAARAGQFELARRAANMAGRPPLTWQPRWSVGSPTAARSDLRKPINLPTAFKSIAMSADGTVVAAVGDDGLVTWSWPVGEVPSHRESVPDFDGYLVLVSLDGAEIIVGQQRRLISLRSGAWETLDRPSMARISAAIPLSGTDYLCVSVDGEVVLCNVLKSKREVLQRVVHLSESWAVAERKGVPVTVSLDAGHQIVLFEHGDSRRDLYPKGMKISSFAISRDGAHLVAGDRNGHVVLTDRASNSKKDLPRVVDGEVTALAFAPGGGVIAVGSSTGEIAIVSLDGVVGALWRHNSQAITSVSIDDTACRVIGLNEIGSVFCYEVRESGVMVSRLLSGSSVEAGDGDSEDDMAVIAFLDLEDTVLACMADGSAALVDLSTGEAEVGERFGAPVRDLALVDIAGSELLLVSDHRGYRLLDELHSDGVILRPEAFGWAAEIIGEKHSSSHIMVNDQLVRVRNYGDVVLVDGLSDGPISQARAGVHLGCEVVECAYFGNRPLIFTGGGDGCVRVWDIESLELMDVLDVGQPVWRIDVIAGRRILVAAGGELIGFDHVDNVREVGSWLK